MKWYRLAADKGHAQAQVNLGLLYDQGMTQGEIAEAQKFSREWKPVAPPAAQAQ